MSEFWYTQTTMRGVYGADYRAFQPFDGTHLFWLCLCLVLCVTLGLWYRGASEQQRARCLRVLVVLLLADELLKYGFTLATGQFEWQYLPLHLCSINIFVCVWYVLKRSDIAAEILYALCLPGALLASLSPSWLPLPLWNIMHLHSASVHILLVLFPVLLLAGGFRPDYRRLWKVGLFLAAGAVCALVCNTLTGTNFMFLNGTDNNPILNIFASLFGEKLYILGFPIILAVLWTAMYLPWVLARRRAAQTAA
ncbi:MAG: TIGR02206 family membrane protein [Oscillospiraceae bacterium]|nr:TIGR02206 family membrane protein [Oscillospiraceae bacterium]